MSTHPNAILLLRLTPDGLSRKTMKDICGDLGDDDNIKIGGDEYHRKILEESYDESWQVGGKEGDLLFFDMVTYGYGEEIEWDRLESQKKKLEKFAIDVCDKHHCSYKILMIANYW